jgi:phospholipid/cholesterol/gamma-HCH transport system ATP-binding protein
LPQKPASAVASPEKIAVEFQHVSMGFGARKILCDISFQVPCGQTLCILGRSGTGKSVTLKLMIGLLKPDSGKVLIDSEDISHSSPEDLSRVRRNIGFLFQSGALFDSFSVGDNLALPLQRLDKSKSREQVRQAIEKTLADVGLGRDKDKMPSELSGGMRKRAGLARALVLDPKLLLVDEPESGLDRITASEIDNLLLKVKTEHHTTLVIVTHDARSARKIADRIAVLEKGELAGFGTAAELDQSDNPIVRQLVSES